MRNSSKTFNIWDSIFRKTATFSSVRRLTIKTELSPPRDIDEDIELYIRESSNEDDNEVALICSRPYHRHILDGLYSDIQGEDAGTWDLLVLFLRRLSGLRDLVWTCGNQFPPCLLQVLHQRLPRCRLHIRAFRLRSIQRSENNLKEMDECELALATSPCLSSVVVPISRRYSNSGVDCNWEAALRLATGLAPNLAHVLRTHS